MANSNPKPKPSRHHVGPWVRHNFLKSIKVLVRKKRKPAHEIMAEWLEAEPVAMLRVVASFEPKDVKVSGELGLNDEATEALKAMNTLRAAHAAAVHAALEDDDAASEARH